MLFFKNRKSIVRIVFVIALSLQGSGNPIWCQISKEQAAKAAKTHSIALKYLNAKRFHEAIPLLRKTIKLNPKQPGPYYNLGIASYNIEDYQTAWKSFNKCVSLSPKVSKTWFWIARSYYKCGDKNGAVNTLKEIKRRFGKSAKILKSADSMIASYSDGEEGKNSLRNLIRLEPNNFAHWNNLAARYVKEKKFDEAVALLEKAGPRFQNNYKYHITLGICLRNSGKYKEAAGEFMTAFKLKPSTKALKSVMNCQTEAGDLEELQKTRRLFVEKFPNDEDTASVKDAITYYKRDFAETRAAEKQRAASSHSCPFSSSDMPLRVYVHNRLQGRTIWVVGQKPKKGEINYSLLIEQALQSWSNASQRKIRFVFTDTPKNANIECKWTTDESQLTHSFAAGETGYGTNESGRRKATIKLLAKLPGSDLTPEVFYGICLHEIGHALGLSHSSKVNDIMYFSETSKSGKSDLSTNDIGRIRKLYSKL